MDISITKATELKTKPTREEEGSLGFGKRFTDHMFMMNYDDGVWHDARIVPYQKLCFDPSCAVFHYAQEIFDSSELVANLDKNAVKVDHSVYDHIIYDSSTVENKNYDSPEGYRISIDEDIQNVVLNAASDLTSGCVIVMDIKD